MSRGYGQGKRQREADKARKKRDKADRRQRKREMGPGEVPITTQEEFTGALPSIDEAMEAIENQATQAREASTMPCRLFVGSLSWETTEDMLRKAFGEYGPVQDAFIVRDRGTGTSRGFGFVTMQDRRDAAKAIEALHESELDGRTIVVNVATERER